MAFLLSPIGNESQIDSNGDPLSGGFIETYLAGTSTPSPTYTDITGAVPQINPIVLNTLGLAPSPIWLNSTIVYKFVFKNSVGIVQRTVDNIAGISSSIPTQDQWVSFIGTPTFISATSFSLTGDQTNTFQIGRRVKTVNTGGIIYSTITASVFGAVTTITVVNDSGVLDSGLSQVSYGLLSATNDSIPATVAKVSYVNFTGTPVQTTAGTAPAYTLAASPAITSYVFGQRFRVAFHASGAVTPPLTNYTININGLGAKNIVGVNVAGVAYIPSIITNYYYDIQYDGASFIVLNPIDGDSGVGELFWWMLNTTPSHGLLCNGGAVSRSTYVRLFSIVGTFYGAGDGSTTFNLPLLEANTTLLSTLGGSEGTFTTGQVISHNHILKTTAVGQAGAARLVVDGAGVTNSFTELFGVSNNLAAGRIARLCIRF